MDYTVEVRNRFKGLDLVDKVPDELSTEVPRSKCLLISWLQSPSAVILEPRKIKSATVSTVSPSICHEVMGPDAVDLSFLNVNILT